MDVKQKSQAIAPTVRIGKAGLTDSVIDEINKQLKKRRLVKIKFLKAASKQKKQLAEKILAKTGAEKISQVGFTLCLYKRKL